jgi:hypothetical protein
VGVPHRAGPVPAVIISRTPGAGPARKLLEGWRAPRQEEFGRASAPPMRKTVANVLAATSPLKSVASSSPTAHATVSQSLRIAIRAFDVQASVAVYLTVSSLSKRACRVLCRRPADRTRRLLLPNHCRVRRRECLRLGL